MATLAPAAASADAVAPPRPDAPPVTMAACPLTSIQTLLGWAAFSTAAPLAKRGRPTHFKGHDRRENRPRRLLAEGPQDPGPGPLHGGRGGGVPLRDRRRHAARHPRHLVRRAGLFRDAVRHHSRL